MLGFADDAVDGVGLLGEEAGDVAGDFAAAAEDEGVCCCHCGILDFTFFVEGGRVFVV